MQSFFDDALFMARECLLQSDVSLPHFLSLCSLLGNVYREILPYAVSYVLLKDLENGVRVVREEYHACSLLTARELVRHQATIEPGREACRKANRNGTKSLLWLQRTCQFMYLLLSGLRDGKTSQEACRLAYDLVLRPYHKWSTQKVASLALSTSLSFDVSAIDAEVVLALGKVSSELHNVLREYDVVFEEKM